MTRQKSTDCDLACAPRDSVDALLQSWAERRPDLDFRPVGVITRLARVRAHLDAELEEVFAESGLTGPSFAALVTLARITGEHGVSQRRLADELGLTPGTVSVRVDRLVEQGLALRAPDPDSQRSTLVALTSRGRALFDRLAPAHLDNEQRLLAALTEPEQQLLADLLRKLLAEFEGSRPAAAGEGRLGLVVTPAHVTMRMRAAVGLPPAPGLLVRSVEPGLPAEQAGILPGDVLTCAGGRDLRSGASLYAALRDSTDSSLTFVVLRGSQTFQTRLTLQPGAAASHAAASGRSSGRPEHTL
ncbi:MAG: transcriptional regulator, MarR family [Actinomycetia bacterium]|nr:transcriptional regulator, MarR family [Actinomycetes bacterium]